MHFRKGNTELKLFTTIATLGTPQDITLQELRIECFFPMDDATNRTLRGWSAAGPHVENSIPTAHQTEPKTD